jgi:hypothetical protein
MTVILFSQLDLLANVCTRVLGCFSVIDQAWERNKFRLDTYTNIVDPSDLCHISRWETKKWPAFVEAHSSYDWADKHKRQFTI